MKHILLLGNGAVGKSTIVSHIKSVFGQTEKEQNGALNAMLKALIQTTSLVCDILLDSEQEFNIPDGVFESMDTIANIASRGRCYVHMKGTPSTPDQKTTAAAGYVLEGRMDQRGREAGRKSEPPILPNDRPLCEASR
jgi:hypothetical protein